MHVANLCYVTLQLGYALRHGIYPAVVLRSLTWHTKGPLRPTSGSSLIITSSFSRFRAFSTYSYRLMTTTFTERTHPESPASWVLIYILIQFGKQNFPNALDESFLLSLLPPLSMSWALRCLRIGHSHEHTPRPFRTENPVNVGLALVNSTAACQLNSPLHFDKRLRLDQSTLLSVVIWECVHSSCKGRGASGPT
ncbi:unnamed protein product [Cyclocybe aegerita]|uniref:Uncharacterized protein n=1 Tax=Cyclocybe aegerita TaxID=1973307 RepID=A0A8S0WK77_CYCAE|nr:unnamed protein product [Cyclocybe aegerita]